MKSFKSARTRPKPQVIELKLVLNGASASKTELGELSFL